MRLDYFIMDWYKDTMILFLTDVSMGIYALTRLWMTNITCGIKISMFCCLWQLHERDTCNPSHMSTCHPPNAKHSTWGWFHNLYLFIQGTRDQGDFSSCRYLMIWWNTNPSLYTPNEHVAPHFQLTKSCLIEDMTSDEIDPEMDQSFSTFDC